MKNGNFYPSAFSSKSKRDIVMDHKGEKAGIHRGTNAFGRKVAAVERELPTIFKSQPNQGMSVISCISK